MNADLQALAIGFAVPFLSTLVLVFFLGLQSLNVNQHRELAAILCSFAIGLCHLFLHQLMPGAGVLQALGFVLGGPVGIVCSMRLHARLRRELAAPSMACAPCRAASDKVRRESLSELDTVDERCTRHHDRLTLSERAAAERRNRYAFEQDCG